MTFGDIFEQYDGDENIVSGLLIVGRGDPGCISKFPDKVQTTITNNIVVIGSWKSPSRFECLLFKLRLKKPYIYKVITSKERS